jgi:Arc/MetJ-type ribon-helix-helix transcriptional regulator
MRISISDEDERILKDAVSSGQFKNAHEALAEALQLLSEKTADQNGIALAADAWRNRFKQHLTSTPATAATFVDDSRESIYEGRGE